MKDFIDERFNTLNWLGQVQQDPIQINLMLKLVRAGYSTSLSRAIISHMPTGMNASDAFRWLLDVLERNLHTESDGQGLSERGGVFAMVGSTGVGKTTSAAKLAAPPRKSKSGGAQFRTNAAKINPMQASVAQASQPI